MPSNTEIYERGALDAEHDEFNSFYYQHYYYYRRGYDETRRRMRVAQRGPGYWVGALVAIVAVAIAVGWWLWPRGASVPDVIAPAPTVRATVVPAPTLVPTVVAPPTVAPTLTPALTVGARARVVNLAGSPLRARESPGLSLVVTRIPEGSEVRISEGPVPADGYIWWRVESTAGAGWVAERSPEGVTFLEVLP